MSEAFSGRDAPNTSEKFCGRGRNVGFSEALYGKGAHLDFNPTFSDRYAHTI